MKNECSNGAETNDSSSYCRIHGVHSRLFQVAHPDWFDDIWKYSFAPKLYATCFWDALQHNVTAVQVAKNVDTQQCQTKRIPIYQSQECMIHTFEEMYI